MTSEWMKVMLEEIARKKSEAEEARLEEQARDDAPARDVPAGENQARPRRGCDTVA
jgi:hypothetical protein